MRWCSRLLACLFAIAPIDATNLRGNAFSCSAPPSIFQGSVSYSGLRPGSRATYRCMTGCYMVGSPTITCGPMGTWSSNPPECRVQYNAKNDNSYKNHDPGYKLYSG